MKRIHKQIIIAVIIAVIIFTILIGLRLLLSDQPENHQPSYPLHLQPIQVLWADSVPSGENFYDAVCKIKNPNQNYGAKNIYYTFLFYDYKNNLVNQRKGSTYIFPNRTKHIIEQRINSSSKIARTVCKIDDANWEKPKDQIPLLYIKQKEYHYYNKNLSEAKGIVVNNSPYGFDKIDVNVILFDFKGNLLGARKHEIRTLLSKSERHFIVSWNYPLKSKVTNVEMIAETNIFNDQNYIR